MALRLLVTAGAFDASDGEIWHVDLSSNRVELWGRWQPPPQLSVYGKGFAGGCVHASHLYVAAHAAVVRWGLRAAKVDGVLHQPDFNDLHHVQATGDELLVVNTGCDAIERFTLDGRFLSHHGLLPSWVLARRFRGYDPASFDEVCAVGWDATAPRWSSRHPTDPYYSAMEGRRSQAFHRMKVPDRVHPNHVVDTPQGTLVTCMKDGTLRALTTMQPLASVQQHPHDGYVVDDALWLTTIDGGVWRLALPLGTSPPRRLVDLLDKRRVGWCRGLLVHDEITVVGLTEVRPGRLPRFRWAEADPRDSRTGLVVLDRKSGHELSWIDMTNRERHTKIFSILEAP